MHSAHEQCFLCKRSNPHKYVYYRDYADLESEFNGLGIWYFWLAVRSNPHNTRDYADLESESGLVWVEMWYFLIGWAAVFERGSPLAVLSPGSWLI